MILLVAALMGCSTSDPIAPDGAIDVPVDAPVGEVCDAFGEACVSAPYPANTLCHDDKGWCVDNVCRPQCTSGTRICASLVLRYAPAGGGYCEPR